MKVCKIVHGFGPMRSLVFDAEQQESGDWIVTDSKGENFNVPAGVFNQAFMPAVQQDAHVLKAT